MSLLDLPLTVRTADADFSCVISAEPGSLIESALPALRSLAGLPSDAKLFVGLSEVTGDWPIGGNKLLAGSRLTTVPDQEIGSAIGVLGLSCVAGPDAGGTTAIDSGQVCIGRGEDADLAIDDPQISRRHAIVTVDALGLRVTDGQSLNGITINGVPVTETARLESGDLLELGSSLVRTTLMCPPIAVLSADGRGRLAVTRAARVSNEWNAPRLSAPPEAPFRTRRPLPLFAAMMAGLLGVGIAVITGYWMFLLLAGLGPVMMLSNAVSDRVGGRKSFRRSMKQYQADRAEYATMVAASARAELREAWHRYPDPAEVLRRAGGPSTRLWELGRDDPHWLCLRLGVGDRPARLAVPDPPVVGPAPIVLDLGALGVTGICGAGRGLLRAMLAQVAVLHSPAELRVIIFSTEPDLLQAHGLPHSGRSLGDWGRVISDDAQAAAFIDELRGRHPSDGVLLILDNAWRCRRLPGMPELLLSCRLATNRLWAVCVEPDRRRLPTECLGVITVDHATHAFGVEQPEGPLAGIADAISPARFAQLIRSLECLTDSDATKAAIPITLNLSELHPGLLGPDVADAITDRWQLPSSAGAVGTTGPQPLVIDLDADGPHFLIAGTTGSGKSELLQTLVAALALAAPPQLISFLLFDYKGGAAFAEAAELPHTTGLVTDLDPNSAMRVLISLRAELRKREAQLATLGFADLRTWRDRESQTCPPRLVIVVDEFAALAGDLPEFITGLVDIAQRGRSLGVHLILATQRPAGVVSPAIKANITGRICLRVTDDHDSVDIIDSPLASSLGRHTPGRGYFRTGKGHMTQFQTARVAGPPPELGPRRPEVRRRLPDGRVLPDPVTTPGPASDALQLAGRTRESLPDNRSYSGDGDTELRHLVRGCRLAAAGLPAVPRPWLPALPATLSRNGAVRAVTAASPNAVESVAQDATDEVRDGTTEVLGLIDLPAEGRQDLLVFPQTSVLCWGPGGSGRTWALRAMAEAAVLASPQTQIIIIDPAGGLQDLREWHSCTTYLDLNDPWLVARLGVRLSSELAVRATTDDAAARPRILVLIDGWEGLGSALDSLDFGVTSTRMLELIGRGPGSGIRFAVTSGPRIQHTRVASAFGLRLEMGPPESLRTTATRVGAPHDDTRYPPGRGRTAGGAEFQFIAADPGGHSSPVTTAGAQAAPTDPGSRGSGLIVIRDLPAAVSGAQLPPSSPAQLFWAVGDDDARPISFDAATTQNSLLVAGPRRSGISTTLRTLMLAANAAGIPIMQVGGGAAGRAAPAVRDVRSETAGSTMQHFGVRDGGVELEAAFAAHQGPLLVIADDGHDLQETPVGALLVKFLQLAGPGQNLILGVRADRLGRSSRGVIAELTGLRRGVLLQPDGQDGAIFDLALPRRRSSGPPGRGVYADRGTGVPVQVAITPNLLP